jgi:hypothetical protein
MKNTNDIYLRAHTLQLEEQQWKGHPHAEKKWPDYVLVFDCETRLSAEQELTFGSWRFCELRGEAYICVDEGFFHAEDIPAHEYDELGTLYRLTRPKMLRTAPSACIFTRARSSFTRFSAWRFRQKR